MMREVEGNFDTLFFTACTFGIPLINGSQLKIPVKGLLLLRGHPLAACGYGPYEGEFIFDGVVSSRRTISEYIGNPQNPSGFKPIREVIDEIHGADVQTESLQEFGFEGALESPGAWIGDWIVIAKSFVLRINKMS